MLPGKVGGTETYLRGLLKGLSKIDIKNQYIIFTNRENHGTFDIKQDNFSEILCDVPAKFRSLRIFWEQVLLPFYIKKHRIDVLHSPGYVSPVWAKCAKVVTIHDMQYFYYPEYFPKAKLLYWRYLIPLSARNSDLVVTVSNNSKIDIINLLNIPAEKVIITYEASKFFIDGLNNTWSDNNTFCKHNIKRDYILSVASLLPHKNLDKLIEGFGLLANKVEHQLVLVGLKGCALNTIRDAIKKKGIKQDRVLLLGYVSDNELVTLYKKASLFVLPSLFEGFGIPLLEAMSLGCPVAASNRTSIPEVVGDAGVLFNPKDSKEIAQKIYSILYDSKLRDDLIKKGYERAKMFSWEKMAKQTLTAYYKAFEFNQRYNYNYGNKSINNYSFL